MIVTNSSYFFLITDSSSRNSIINLAKPISELNLKKESDEESPEDDSPSTSTQDEVDEENKPEPEPPVEDNTKYLKGRKFLSFLRLQNAATATAAVPSAAERKEYLPIDPEVNKEDSKPCRSQQVSVIQRTPAVPSPSSTSDDSSEEVDPVQEPEQDAPIDYHVPKKPSDSDDEVKPKLILPVLRQQPSIFKGKKVFAKSTHIMGAAAGHSRNNNNSQNCNGNSQNTNGGGTNRSSSAGHGNYNGNGVNVFNGGYNGAVNGGGDRPNDGNLNGGGGGKCGYEPGGSPIMSLPPFDVSLKGGHLAGYHQQLDQYSALPNEHGGMDYDTGQDVPIGNLFPTGADLFPKSYSLMQNLYGLTMKDDDDVSLYLKEQNFMNYDDSLMMDPVTVSSAADPLQFSTTVSFTNSHAEAAQILDQLPDGHDLFMRPVSSALEILSEFDWWRM